MNERGYQAKEVMKLTGLSYRQIDHWVRTEIITPSQIVQKGDRHIRFFSFADLVTIRAAMKLLDFGVSFPVVKKTTKWLQEALKNGLKGEFLFVASGDNLTLLSDDPGEIAKLMRGKCAVTIDLNQIIIQLKKDIENVNKENVKNKKRKGYAIPEIASA